MSTSVLVEGHSISGTDVLPRNDSYLTAKLIYTGSEQNYTVSERESGDRNSRLI